MFLLLQATEKLGKKKHILNGLCMIIFFSENLLILSVMLYWTACNELSFNQATCGETDSLSEVSFSDGQIIVYRNEDLQGLYIVQEGQVSVTFDVEMVRSQNASSLVSENQAGR